MSGQTGESATPEHPIDEQAVLDYLRAHPELLQRHPDLVGQIDVPHPTGGVTSLIEYQVSILREENHALAERLDQLLQVARDNDRLVEQIHRFTLELLAANDLDSVLMAIRDGLRHDFRADVVEVILIGESLGAAGAPVLAPDDPRAQQLEDTFPGDQPVLGALDAEHRGLIFGDQADGLGSVAVIPMDEPPVRGFIAIGSRDADRYHGEQGTIFLGQLGALAARVLRRSSVGE
ncbi:hypothetical protein SPICUR_00125 [Spiribacter curvatus]|uniref:Phytochrome sensor protein n=1 Tax=Spiribacter curvatus TaxID=1335757 RepID=U5T0J6_9GAMM|nr:DUF484 family protein [Spiribacter curvatus]AGY91054.1 hypothetical protein SPICUR_00125 [Spiribacter curvatus]